jgi:hypothetical protein
MFSVAENDQARGPDIPGGNIKGCAGLQHFRQRIIYQQVANTTGLFPGRATLGFITPNRTVVCVMSYTGQGISALGFDNSYPMSQNNPTDRGICMTDNEFQN